MAIDLGETVDVMLMVMTIHRGITDVAIRTMTIEIGTEIIITMDVIHMNIGEVLPLEGDTHKDVIITRGAMVEATNMIIHVQIIPTAISQIDLTEDFSKMVDTNKITEMNPSLHQISPITLANTENLPLLYPFLPINKLIQRGGWHNAIIILLQMIV